MGTPTIRDFPADPIEVEYKKFSRNGCYREAALIKKCGGDIVLPDLLALIAGDCDKRTALGNQGCGAIYPALGRVQKRNLPSEFR